MLNSGKNTSSVRLFSVSVSIVSSEESEVSGCLNYGNQCLVIFV